MRLFFLLYSIVATPLPERASWSCSCRWSAGMAADRRREPRSAPWLLSRRLGGGPKDFDTLSAKGLTC
jgi:hypothetical protein